MADINLRSKLDVYRSSEEPEVCLSVYSVPDLDIIDFATAKAAVYRSISPGESLGPSWVSHNLYD